MKKKLYILLALCLAAAILAGCIAAEATKPKGGELSGESVIEGHKETASDEVSEDNAGSDKMTESVASEDEPSDEPIEDEPSEDEPITNTAYDWDFQKGWPVFVFRADDLEEFRMRTWPACEFPHGNAEWNYVAKEFDGEEILIHAELCVGEKQKAFMQSLGIPYEPVVNDEIILDERCEFVHLDMSYADSVRLIDLMYEAGLCMENHPNMFGLCYCDDLNNKTNTVSLKLPEDELLVNTAYDWDFQKGWPLFVFREEDQDKYMDYPDMCFPYGNPRWVCLAGAFDTLGEELLFHVDLPLCIEKETEPFLQSLGVPYELHYDQIVGQQLIHLNLSYADSIELLDLMYEAGVTRSNMDAVFDFCYCGDTCGESNTVSPELPVWYDILDY